ncbi:MAG: hypothetical protein ACJA14_002542 [Ilumatobacter sp.]|jgi:hypothetical protein
MASIGLGFSNPDPQRLVMHTELLADLVDCLPLRPIVALVIEHHAYSAFLQLRPIPP